ncbi:MAG: type IV pilin [Thermoplasmata archaeon]|nr:MAG: type IV pilin [Thermoplasmata archaeon]
MKIVSKIHTNCASNRRHYSIRPARAIRKFRKDYGAVSEALGTILLLLISIVLVSMVAVWLNSIPKEDETPQVDLVASYNYEEDELTIKHHGGEVLYDDETEIVIKRNIMNITRWSPSDGGIDDVWGIGDEWKFSGLELEQNE